MPKTHDYLIRSTPVTSGDNSLPEKKLVEKKSRLQSTPAAKTSRGATSLPTRLIHPMAAWLQRAIIWTGRKTESGVITRKKPESWC